MKIRNKEIKSSHIEGKQFAHAWMNGKMIYNHNNFYFKVVNGEATLIRGNCDQKGILRIPSYVKDDQGRAYPVTNIEGGEATSYDATAFYDNSNITEIHIPGSVKSIGINAFCGCGNVRVIDIAEGVETLNVWSFRNIPAGWYDENVYMTLNIPSSIKNLSVAGWQGPFVNNGYPGGAGFNQQKGVRCYWTVNFAETIQTNTIPTRMFYNCGTFNKLEFPEGIAVVEEDALAQNAYGSITFPESLQTLKNAFGDFYGMNNMYFKGDVPEVLEGDINALKAYLAGKIYVPAKYYDNYVNDSMWSGISDKIMSR